MEHVSQAALFLEDAGDLSQALNRDVDEMSMDEQVVQAARKTSRTASIRTYMHSLIRGYTPESYWALARFCLCINKPCLLYSLMDCQLHATVF